MSLAPETRVEGDFHRPSLLPDGRSLIFAVDHISDGTDTIGVLVNKTRKNVLTIKGEVLDSPVYSPTGHILFHRENASPGIWAVPFDLSTLESTGPPFLVAAQGSYPSMASTGTLIYCENSVTGLATLPWLDLESAQITPATTGRFSSLTYPRLSPGGRYVAAGMHVPGEGQAVIVIDLQRDTHIRFAADVSHGAVPQPEWAGERMIVYPRTLNGASQLIGRPADGSAGEVVLARGMMPTIAALVARVGYDVSPDGKRLLMVDEAPGGAQRGTSVTVAQNWFAAFKK